MLGKDILINAVGHQDKYLTENPEFSHFKTSYSRHSNFSQLLTAVDPTKLNDTFQLGETVNFIVDKASDLLTGVHVEICVRGNDWTNSSKIVPQTMYHLLESVELNVGSTCIQRLTGDWLFVHDQLQLSSAHKNAVEHMAFASARNKTGEDGGLRLHTLHYTLPFFFHKSAKNALPLWALQNEKISINLKIRNIAQTNAGPVALDCSVLSVRLLADFCDVQESEKQYFVSSPLEYVIQQVETTESRCVQSASAHNVKISIDNHPYMTEVVFAVQDVQALPSEHFDFRYSSSQPSYFSSTKLLLNGKPLHQTKYESSALLRFQQYEGVNTQSLFSAVQNKNNMYASYHPNAIHVLPYALDSESVDSSGFLNTNKCNTVHLSLHFKPDSSSRHRVVKVFVKKLNILRIFKGHLDIVAN